MVAGWRMSGNGMEGKGLINVKISMGIKLLLPKISEIAFPEYLYITGTLLKKNTTTCINFKRDASFDCCKSYLFSFSHCF